MASQASTTASDKVESPLFLARISPIGSPVRSKPRVDASPKQRAFVVLSDPQGGLAVGRFDDESVSNLGDKLPSPSHVQQCPGVSREEWGQCKPWPGLIFKASLGPKFVAAPKKANRGLKTMGHLLNSVQVSGQPVASTVTGNREAGNECTPQGTWAGNRQKNSPAGAVTPRVTRADYSQEHCAMQHLPDWIEQDTWDAFVAMRQKMRLPLSDFAAKRVLNKLEMFHLNGYVADEMLGEAVERSWRTVFMYPDCPRRQLSAAETKNVAKITQLSLGAIKRQA